MPAVSKMPNNTTINICVIKFVGLPATTSFASRTFPPVVFPPPFPNSIGKKEPLASSEGSGGGFDCEALGEGLGVGEGLFVVCATITADGSANTLAIVVTEGIAGALAIGKDDTLGATVDESAIAGDALGELLTSAVANGLT
jgi:hypothetical protein